MNNKIYKLILNLKIRPNNKGNYKKDNIKNNDPSTYYN